MATAVGEGGFVGKHGAGALEFAAKVGARPPTAKTLLI